MPCKSDPQPYWLVSEGSSSSSRRRDSELLEKRQLVEELLFLRDQVVLESTQDDALQFHGFARGGKSEEVSAVRSGHFDVSTRVFVFRYLIENDDFEIGKSSRRAAMKAFSSSGPLIDSFGDL